MTQWSLSRHVPENGTSVFNRHFIRFFWAFLAKSAFARPITAHNLVSSQFRSPNDLRQQTTVIKPVRSWYSFRLNSGEKIALLSGVKTYRNVVLATLTAMAVTIPAFGAEGKGSGKVDRALAGSLKAGGKQKVLITTQPGEREHIKKHLGKRGGKLKAEHASLNLLVGEYTTEEILELAKDNKIKGLSLDELVNAQQLSSLTGNLLGSDSVVAESLTSLASTLGPVTTTLRQTLGLSAIASGWNAPKGSGIGVAIIDSGIASERRLRRAHHRLLRLHERAQRRRRRALRRLRSRHARRRADRQQRRAVGLHAPGRRAGGAAGRAEGARWHRRG